MKPVVICIMGPTATGKTDAAAALYDQYDCELVSVDSSLVYRGMNVGTAKPDASFLAQYPHRLIDIREPNDVYSAADFVADATQSIQAIVAAGRVPVLVGGTFFYFSALTNGLSDVPSADPKIRQKINEQAEALGGWPQLHAHLAELDPVSAARIDPNDTQRIQRAMEINLVTGNPVPENPSQGLQDQFEFVKIGLSFSDRRVLHDRIQRRFHSMVDAGLVEEIESLLAAGVDADAASMKMIGYRQVLEFLRGDITKEAAIEKAIVATRQLAKRQLTWMRNQSNLVWWVDHGLQQKEFTAFAALVGQYLR